MSALITLLSAMFMAGSLCALEGNDKLITGVVGGVLLVSALATAELESQDAKAGGKQDE